MSRRTIAWSVGVLAAVTAAGGAVVAQGSRASRAERRHTAQVVGGRAAHAVEQQITLALSATYALAAVIRQHGEVADFDTMAAEMLRIYGGISSLQLAPGGVLSRIHPLAGNEAAVGHDLLADPKRATEARAAIASRQLSLAGPFPLRQGGVGVVGRYPVFVADGGGERFWGFANVLVRLPDLLQASQLDQLDRQGYAYALSRRLPDGGQEETFAASVGPAPEDPVQVAIRVPGGEWSLAVAPRAGWAWKGEAGGYALALFLGLAFALLAGRLARQPDALREQVSRRTAELGQAYRRLEEDMGRRQRAEEQLRRSQKMEAIGLLAGGVAHDFNNLLTGILGCAEEIVAGAAPGSPEAEAARTIEQAAQRGAGLTRQLLGFARRGKFRTAPVDLHATVAEVTGLLSRTIDKRIALETRLDAPRAVVVGDAGQLQQAVLNLAVNARDAMPEGGTLTFSTRLEEISSVELHTSRPGNASPGTFLALAVADTGHGIPVELQERIFEPFFTTKEPGRGTGMGLATVYGIASNHGGWVSVESEAGRGARFVLRLPLAPAEVQVRRTPRPAAPAGTGRVLVVDDEQVVRETAGRMLKRLGYEAVLVTGGAEAADWLRQHPGEADLVLLDLAMPGLDGRDTFRALRRLQPDLRVVLSSGYGRDGRAQELLDEGVADFVEKPYQLEQLAAALIRAKGEGT